MGCSSGKSAERQAADPAATSANPDTKLASPELLSEQQQREEEEKQQQQQPQEERQASGGDAGCAQAAGAGDVVLSFDDDGSPANTGVAHAPSAPVIHDPAASPPANTSTATGAREGAASSKFDAQGRRRQVSHTAPASYFQAAECNGFKTIREVPSLVIMSEANMAEYTLPSEALSFEPPPEAVIAIFKNGDQERKIYTNTKLDENEYQYLAKLREEAKASESEFYPSVTCMATRFLSRARNDPKKALKLMKDTQNWRAQYFQDGPITDTSLLEDLKHGIVYFTGRDFCLRPAIVIRAARIPQQWYKEKRIDKFIRMLIFCMEYFLRYMVVPGRVENLSVIADLGSLGISQVPLTALGEVYKVLGHHYIGRVFKFYVVHVSMTLSTIAGMAKSWLTDRQKQKLNILDDINELHKEFALTQLETDLGGSRPKLDKFFPFPLRPGPYTPGYNGDILANAVPNVHEAITHGGACGRLWDPKLSLEENTRLEYTPKAAAILERCGLPVPEAIFNLDGDGPVPTSSASRSAESLPVEQSCTACSATWEQQLPLGPQKAASQEMTPSTDDVEGYRDNMHMDDCGSPLDDLDFRVDEVIGGHHNPEIQGNSVTCCCSL